VWRGEVWRAVVREGAVVPTGEGTVRR